MTSPRQTVRGMQLTWKDVRGTATWRAGVPGNVTPRLQPENVTAPTVLITTTTKKRTGTDRTLVLLLLHHHLLLLILMTKRNKARAVESMMISAVRQMYLLHRPFFSLKDSISP